jgi:hypothetical protein
MKKRTKKLAGWIKVFCIIGIAGSVISLIQPPYEDLAGAFGGLILSIILLASVQLMKSGSKLGWWVLEVFFGLMINGVLIFGLIPIFNPEKRSQIWEKEPAITIVCFILLLGGLFILPFILLLTDPPWKWTNSNKTLNSVKYPEDGTVNSSNK